LRDDEVIVLLVLWPLVSRCCGAACVGRRFGGHPGCRLRPSPEGLIALLDMDPLHPGGAVCLPLLPPARTGPARVVLASPQPSP
jgi:hypothetical protein